MGVSDIIFGLVFVPLGLWIIINPRSVCEPSDRRGGGREYTQQELVLARLAGAAGILLYVAAVILF
ncbi:hypothetical protein [Amycolatopsis viridis]|uniref:Uncharacterized protein n=1 Tax=Amycolatopsis viridis TaxID=185678 RepID=A0ABX0SRE5_9PSEU|nr:hypothetical protein [Amycolatopsis viridis]NIH77915.1 hypothetical protein [Amycolatopsis viridis]